jgi:hypothetical protein
VVTVFEVLEVHDEHMVSIERKMKIVCANPPKQGTRCFVLRMPRRL